MEKPSGASAVGELLSPGEKVLWLGRPALTGFDWRDALKRREWILKTLTFAYFVTLAREIYRASQGDPFQWGAFLAIPAVAIGWALWVRSNQHKEIYAVTDRQIIITENTAQQSSNALRRAPPPTATFKARADGLNDVYFDGQPTSTGFFDKLNRGPLAAMPVRFLAIADADALRHVLNESRSTLVIDNN